MSGAALATGDRRAIFVTGAASGIGFETARLFAARGWFVGLFDVDEPGLRRAASEIGPEQSCWRTLDVVRPGEFRDAVAFFRAASGERMDVLFNCAGILRMGPFERIPIEEQIRVVEVNVLGPIVGIHAAFELLRRTPGARVITMGSASGIYGVPELATYSASKFFVRGLTEALSLELERHGVTVTDVMPPYVRTPMVTSQTYPHGTLRTLGVKLGPEKIAEVVWRAAHDRKLHWLPTLELRVQAFFTRLFPGAARPAMRYLSRPGAQQRGPTA